MRLPIGKFSARRTRISSTGSLPSWSATTRRRRCAPILRAEFSFCRTEAGSLFLDHSLVDWCASVRVGLAVVILIRLDIEKAAALEPLAVMRQRPFSTELAPLVDAPRADDSGPPPFRILQVPGKGAVRLVLILGVRTTRRLAADVRATERALNGFLGKLLCPAIEQVTE